VVPLPYGRAFGTAWRHRQGPVLHEPLSIKQASISSWIAASAAARLLSLRMPLRGRLVTCTYLGPSVGHAAVHWVLARSTLYSQPAPGSEVLCVIRLEDSSVQGRVRSCMRCGVHARSAVFCAGRLPCAPRPPRTDPRRTLRSLHRLVIARGGRHGDHRPVQTSTEPRGVVYVA
jgi:hypothetical protein